MSVRPEVLVVTRQWVQKAEEDFFCAERLLVPDETMFYTALCFHAQQCVEKYMKGILVLLSIDFPRTHDLEAVFKLIPEEFVLPISKAERERLTHCATAGRYPGDWYPVDRESALEAVAVARRVREAVRALMPKEALDS